MTRPTRDEVVVRLGAILAERRVALGLSQAEVADRLGLMSPETISRYERAEREPRFSTLLRLADVLGLTVTEIIREVERGETPGGPLVLADAPEDPVEEAARLVAQLARADFSAARLALAALRAMAESVQRRG